MKLCAWLALGVTAALAGCAGTAPSEIRLPAGSQALLASASGGQNWTSSDPAIARIEWQTDSRGLRQPWLIAGKPGVAILSPGRSARVVGPIEVILNQSEFNKRMAGPPPARPPGFRVTVEPSGPTRAIPGRGNP